jgi:hypothetical protein
VHGSSGAQIRAQIESTANKVSALSDVRIWVDGTDAVAMYKIATTAVDKVGVFGSDVWAATRIRVQSGQITQVESICSGSALCGEQR